MKLEDFKAGEWKQQYQYKSFVPGFINREWTWDDPGTNMLLAEANRALGELNAFSLIVPDIDLFIQMHVAKEAQTSSRIEGTQTELDEVLMPENQIAAEKRDDWREIQNYIQAMNESVDALNRLPLSNRLLKQAHETMLQGVRGKHKQPGEFRSSQNWIGGSNLKDAAFIPPHAQDLPDLMSDMEQFWHNDTVEVPHLIRLAISHYQFETIHPFCDGNGRVGRLMIPLYLISHQVLAKPSLYLSDFFERNRASYYDALMQVRVSNDLVHWVRYFLNGVLETATKGRNVFQQILLLRTETEKKVLALGRRSANAQRLLSLLYRKSIVTAADISSFLEISTPTANALIKEMQKLGIMKEITGLHRKRAYVFEAYLKLFFS
ncbi:MAG: Fic family protein [Mariprofundus sp.]|nr:Fic family protein [Mariprofundus sp.]